MEAMSWSAKLQLSAGSEITLSQISKIRNMKNPIRWDQIFTLSLFHVNKLKITTKEFYTHKHKNMHIRYIWTCVSQMLPLIMHDAKFVCDWIPFRYQSLSDVTHWLTGLHHLFTVCHTPFTRYNRLSNRLYNRLSNRLYNRFDNRLYCVYKHLTGCQTGFTTGCIV